MNRQCTRCKGKGHKEAMCWKKMVKPGKVKEVKELPPREGTLSSGGEVGLISYGVESDAFQITASSNRRLGCRACTYQTPHLKPSKAEQKLCDHREKCDIMKVSNDENEFNTMESSRNSPGIR